MWSWQRKLRTRAALRAAAAVAVSLGGCVPGADSSAVWSEHAIDGGSADGGALAKASDAGRATTDAGGTSESLGGRSGHTTADATANADSDGGQVGADAVSQSKDSSGDTEAAQVADAGLVEIPDAGPRCNIKDDWQVYEACCKEMNWDFKAGCMAWGPPAPPAMIALA